MKFSFLLIVILTSLIAGCGETCGRCTVAAPSVPEVTVISNDVLWDKNGCAYLRQTVRYGDSLRPVPKLGGRLPVADRPGVSCKF